MPQSCSTEDRRRSPHDAKARPPGTSPTTPAPTTTRRIDRERRRIRRCGSANAEADRAVRRRRRQRCRRGTVDTSRSASDRGARSPATALRSAFGARNRSHVTRAARTLPSSLSPSGDELRGRASSRSRGRGWVATGTTSFDRSDVPIRSPRPTALDELRVRAHTCCGHRFVRRAIPRHGALRGHRRAAFRQPPRPEARSSTSLPYSGATDRNGVRREPTSCEGRPTPSCHGLCRRGRRDSARTRLTHLRAAARDDRTQGRGSSTRCGYVSDPAASRSASAESSATPRRTRPRSRRARSLGPASCPTNRRRRAREDPVALTSRRSDLPHARTRSDALGAAVDLRVAQPQRLVVEFVTGRRRSTLAAPQLTWPRRPDARCCCSRPMGSRRAAANAHDRRQDSAQH